MSHLPLKLRMNQKFKQADALFQSGQYAEARQLLAELNAEFPDTPNILHPLALCLEKLGRPDLAVQICDQLILKHQDKRAQEMKTRIQANPAPAPAAAPGMDMNDLGDIGGVGGMDMNNLDVGVMDMGNLGDIGGMDIENIGDIGGMGAGGMNLDMEPSRPAAPRPMVNQGRDWTPFYWCGGLMVVFILGTMASMVQSSFILSMAGSISSSIASFVLLSYLCLKIVDGLPSDEISENVKHIALTYCMIVGLCITIIGILAVPFLVAWRYELSFLRFLGCFAMYVGLAIVIGLVMMAAFMVAGVSLFAATGM